MFPKQQRGVALIVSLIMLLLMTILGLAALRTSLLEEKMAANTRDKTLAFEASEIGLRDAEWWIMSRMVEPIPTTDGSNNVWSADALDPDINNAQSWWHENTRSTAWWSSNGREFGQDIDNIQSRPRTVIEFHQYIEDDLVLGTGNTDTGRVFYRITSKGTGGSDQSRVLLQSTVAKRY